MSNTLTLKVPGGISSVNIIKENVTEHLDAEEPQIVSAELEAEKDSIIQAGQALAEATNEFKRLNEEVFISHREQIARLSVEIARKILQKKIEEGKYDIEKIIQQALKTVSSQEDIVIRLNPNDQQHLQQTAKEKGSDVFANVKLVPDVNIGPAQCIVETDKGMIEYLIEAHLAQITEALKSGGSD